MKPLRVFRFPDLYTGREEVKARLAGVPAELLEEALRGLSKREAGAARALWRLARLETYGRV